VTIDATDSDVGPRVRERGRRVDDEGRAYAGSQLQLQIYVNVERRRAELDRAVVSALRLPTPELDWVSPLKADKYREYRDKPFLEKLGLGRLFGELKAFWPASGPRWDGLARAPGDRVILIEAKSYPGEVFGPGCAATDAVQARTRIEKALQGAAKRLDVRDAESVADASRWMGRLYQYANRLTHALFLRDHGVDAYMVNVCFSEDPNRRRRTTEAEWKTSCASLKLEVGLTSTPDWLVDVTLPARDRAELLEI
jgi:hypothetical protein